MAANTVTAAYSGSPSNMVSPYRNSSAPATASAVQVAASQAVRRERVMATVHRAG